MLCYEGYVTGKLYNILVIARTQRIKVDCDEVRLRKGFTMNDHIRMLRQIESITKEKLLEKTVDLVKLLIAN